MNKGLTWNELATLYDKENGGRRARTLPMEIVFTWAENQQSRFSVHNDGTLHLSCARQALAPTREE